MHVRDDDDLDLIPLNEAGEDEDSGTGLQFGDFRQDSIAPPSAAGDEPSEPQGSILGGLNLGGFIDTPGDESSASLPDTGVGMLPVDEEPLGVSPVSPAGAEAAPTTAALLFEDETPAVGTPIEAASVPAVTPVPKKSLQAARSFGAHEASVVSAAASLDQRWVATGDAGGTVQVRHPGGSGGATIAAGASGAMAIAFLPGSATLACAGRDGVVRLFDTATGSPKGQLPLRAKCPRAIASTSAGNWLAVAGCENSVWLFDTSTLEHRGTLAGTFWTRALAFDPTAPRLAQACVHNSDIALWDVQIGAKTLILPSSGGEPTSLAFSPDGAWVAAGCADGSVRAWDAHTGRAARPARTACCRSVSFLASDLVASGGPGGVCIWHVGTDAVVPVALQSVEGELRVVAGVADGPFVIAGGADGAVLAFDVLDG